MTFLQNKWATGTFVPSSGHGCLLNYTCLESCITVLWIYALITSKFKFKEFYEFLSIIPFYLLFFRQSCLCIKVKGTLTLHFNVNVIIFALISLLWSRFYCHLLIIIL